MTCRQTHLWKRDKNAPRSLAAFSSAAFFAAASSAANLSLSQMPPFFSTTLWHNFNSIIMSSQTCCTHTHPHTQNTTSLKLLPKHYLKYSVKLQWKHKAIVDHTSPALCTPITLFMADPICSERGRWNDPFCCMTLLVTELSLLQRTRYNAPSMGKKTPKTAPSPWDSVTLPEEDQATTIDNMHKKFGKDRVDLEICSRTDRCTDRQTYKQTGSSQYSTTALAG